MKTNILNPLKYLSPALRSGLILIATMVGIGLFVTLIEPPKTPFVATFAQTYNVARLLTIVFTAIAVWEISVGIRTIWHTRVGLHWRIALRSSWIPVLISGMVILPLVLLTNDNVNPDDPFAWEQASRVIETIIPLAMGIQAALLFSPADEPAIEIQLASPRTIAWVLIERLLVVMGTQTLIALTGIIIVNMRFDNIDPAISLIRWIAPALLLSGVGVFTTIRSQQMMFGMVVAGAVWFGMLFFSVLFLPGTMIFYPLNYIQPFLWIINPYLQPEHLPMYGYWLNRLCVSAFGIVLLALSIRSLRDEEHILTGIKAD